MPKRKSAQNPKPSRIATPGYGFPKSTKGLLPWSWAEQRLKKSHNYWITTVKPDNSPHTMVVWGLWQDGRLLFSTGSKSRKARNLAQNPIAWYVRNSRTKRLLWRASRRSPTS